MSDEKDKDVEKQVTDLKLSGCLVGEDEDEDSENPKTSEGQSVKPEFIDLHTNDTPASENNDSGDTSSHCLREARYGTPVEEIGDNCNNTAWTKRCESRLNQKLLKEGADSEDEYHSADDGEEDDIENGKEDRKDDADDEEYRKTIEESLSDDEKLERKTRAQEHKDEGNKFFRDAHYNDAIKCYCQALGICPLSFPKERSIMFSNRAACKMKMEEFEAAIADCSKALELHPHYLKALLRRAELYEKTEKLDEALADYQKAIELDPNQYLARAACVKLAEQIKDRNEKMKTEMLGKLKDLGNMILRPFGMSTDNFNLQQDPNTGSYSVQFKQKE